MDFRVLQNSVLLITAVVYAIAVVICELAGIFGLWFFVLVALSFWRYGYTLLRYAAQGKVHIPPPDLESMNPIAEIGLIFHFIAFPALIALIGIYTPFGSAVPGILLNAALMLSVAAVFPASAAVMGLTESLAESFNPRGIAGVMRALGREYALLVGVCLALLAFVWALRIARAAGLGFIGDLVFLVAQIWTVLAVFAMIGATLYAHRDSIEIPGIGDTPEEREERERMREWRLSLDHAYSSLRSGLTAEGYATLRKLIEANDHSWLLYYWLFEQMLEWQDPKHALNVAKTMIERHAAEDDMPSAYALFLRCRRLSPQLEFAPELAAKLSEHARSIGQMGVASELGGAR